MSYSLTSATDLNDVVAQIAAFAVANAGFSAESDVNLSGRIMKRLSKGGLYWHIVTYGSGINIFMSYSLESTDAIPTTGDAQPYVTKMSTWSFTSSFPSLYLYTDDSSVVFAVLEVTTGVFNHLGFGNITKLETFDGGEFVAGGYVENTYYSGGSLYYHSVDYSSNSAPYLGQYASGASHYTDFLRIDDAAGDYQDFAPAGTTLNDNKMGFSAVKGLPQEMLRDSPNAGTMRTPFFPMYVSIYDSVSELYRLSGYVPGVRVAPNKYFDPAEILLTTWQCFPLTQKDATGLICAPCGNYGLAYERV